MAARGGDRRLPAVHVVHLGAVPHEERHERGRALIGTDWIACRDSE